MCYDISFKVQLEEIKDYFPEIEIDEQLKFSWPQYEHVQGPELFPKVPIVFHDKKDNKLRLRLMEWGVIRQFEKEEPLTKNRNFNLNIMSEKIFDSKSYWYKIRNNRCLVPLTGTFEHRGIQGLVKKVPYLIKPKDQKVFFMPGLYTSPVIVDKSTGEAVTRYTWGMITREPVINTVMRQIHNSSERGFRMAHYVPLELAKEFVSADLSEDQYKTLLYYEMPKEDLEYYTVDTIRGSKPRKDGKPKYEPFQWANLPPLGNDVMNKQTKLL